MDRGLAPSRAAARRAIKDGAVIVDGNLARKPARQTPSSVEIAIDDEARRVGRGGRKLSFAFRYFPIDPGGRSALDAGASTGGFTEELLRVGAESVVAVDVGHGQLDAELAADPRVRNIEGVNVRSLTAGDLGGPFDLLVVDLSFISLGKVAQGLATQISEDADVVLLVKPQFEVGPDGVDRGGIVRSSEARLQAFIDVADAWGQLGWHVHGAVRSPVLGGDGNVEYLMWLRNSPGPAMTSTLAELAAPEAP